MTFPENTKIPSEVYSWNQYFLLFHWASPCKRRSIEDVWLNFRIWPSRADTQSQKAEVRAAYWQPRQRASERPARKHTGLQTEPLLHLWTTALLRKSRRRWEEKKKTAQSTVCPCASRTSPFCFGAAAGPDWLIASLIQFSRALLQRLSTFIRILYQRLLACGSKI